MTCIRHQPRPDLEEVLQNVLTRNAASRFPPRRDAIPGQETEDAQIHAHYRRQSHGSAYTAPALHRLGESDASLTLPFEQRRGEGPRLLQLHDSKAVGFVGIIATIHDLHRQLLWGCGNILLKNKNGEPLVDLARHHNANAHKPCFARIMPGCSDRTFVGRLTCSPQ